MASITVRGKRRKAYLITVSLGYKNDGRQNLKTTTFIPPPGLTEKQGLKAAKEYAAAFEKECRGFTNFDGSMTFNELSAWYFKTVAPETLRISTREKRQAAIARHFLPQLGRKKLRELPPALLSAHLAGLRDGGLSPVTVNIHRAALSTMFNAAVQQKIINYNPIKDVRKLRVDSKTQAVLTPKHFKDFLSGVSKLDYIGVRGLLVTMLYTGARTGELRALTWNDINFDKGVISINKGVDQKGRVGATKSKTSNRSLKMVPFLLNFLFQHRRDVEYFAVGMGSAWTDNNLVFPNTHGGYIPHKMINGAVKKIIAGTDIPPNVHPHSLRHTFASIMISEGWDVKTVQASLGHGSAKITLDIYGHAFDEARAAAMDNTGDVISRAAGDAAGALLLSDSRAAETELV